MPDILGPVFEPYDIGRVCIGAVEKKKKNIARILRIDGEVDSVRRERSSEWIE
jgi:hypothetical protein